MSFVEKERFRGKRLLILDDEPSQLQEAADAMRARGFEVITWLLNANPNLLKNKYREGTPFFEAEEERISSIKKPDQIIPDRKTFGERVAATNFDALLTDYGMLSDFKGIEAIKDVAAAKGDVPMMMHSGAYEQERQSGRSDNAERYLQQDIKRVHSVGGTSAFEKGKYDEISEAFATAFTARSKRV